MKKTCLLIFVFFGVGCATTPAVKAKGYCLDLQKNKSQMVACIWQKTSDGIKVVETYKSSRYAVIIVPYGEEPGTRRIAFIPLDRLDLLFTPRGKNLRARTQTWLVSQELMPDLQAYFKIPAEYLN